MTKKKLKKRIKTLRHDVDFLAGQVALLINDVKKHHCQCENYKPKTVVFKRFVPITELYQKQEEIFHDTMMMTGVCESEEDETDDKMLSEEEDQRTGV